MLIDDFGRYVSAYDDLFPFATDQLTAHQQTIALRHEAGTVRAAASHERFVSNLRQTLIAWGIGGRASYLVSETEFAQAMQAAAPSLTALEPLTIDGDLPDGIADRLWAVMDSLGVVNNKAKLVAGTKTLHHLLPDLVVPIDRAWTGKFFQVNAYGWQSAQLETYRRIYNQFVRIARHVAPEQYVTGEGWRTSCTKILDNAVIGFCKLELATHPPGDDAAPNQVSFHVSGYPPAKNEALSMLGSGHSHASRVRLLLEAARQALNAQDFVPIGEGRVALELVVHVPPDQPAWDATNYLGGVADVLEDKTRRGPLDHLGELAAVWLYRNDRQVKEVTYSEVESDHASYTITVRDLGNRKV